jgi:serine/threonine protein kinase
MAIAGVAGLVETLSQAQLLDEEQRRQLPELGARIPEPVELARELMRRGWLTAYQVNQLFLGRAADLLRGPYLLLDRLGEGGMGQVFKARHRSLGRVVALKVVRKDCLDNPRALPRFQREIQAAAQLDHPNVVRALDADQADGSYFFAMEYIEGTDLARLVKERGPLPVLQALDYARQAALGLQHAFERGLIHRDIKPANLLVATTNPASNSRTSTSRARSSDTAYRWGVLKILDMGLARVLDSSDGPSSTMLTQVGSVVGTPDYIAPEQARNSHTSDIRADLYSLGGTLYYLLAGRPPFPVGNVTEKLLQHQLDEPEPLPRVRRERLLTGAGGRADLVRGRDGLDVPDAVVNLVKLLMAKRPENRFQTPAELADAITALVAGLEKDRPARSKLQPTEKTLTDGTVITRVGPAAHAAQPADPAAQLTATSPLPRKSARTQRIRRPDLVLRRWLGTRTRGKLVCSGLFLVMLLAGRALDRPVGETAQPATPTTAAEAAWARLVQTAGRPGGDAEGLRGALVAFRARYPGTTPSRAAAEMLAGLPSPLDRLQASALPPKARLFWVHPDLVAVLGRPLPLLIAPGQCVAFSPDGAQVACGGADKRVRRWQIAPLRELPPLEAHRARIDRLAYAPDGRTLASASQDGKVILWDAATGAVRKSWEAHNYPVSGLIITPDGSTLATASWDGTVKLWDAATGSLLRTLSRGNDNRALSLAVSPDGRLLACGHEDFAVRLWDLTIPAVQPCAVYSGNTSWVKVVAFAPDGRTFVSGGGGDGTLRVCSWDGIQFRDGPVLHGHSNVVHGIAFAPDGKTVLSASEDRSLKVWDVATGKHVRGWAGLDGAVNGVAFAPDGRHLAMANANSTVYVLRLAGPPREVLPRPAGRQ